MDIPAVETPSLERNERPKAKRTRIAIACQRCRTRKQKCNGAQDACSTCARLGLECHYKPQITCKPGQKKVYIGALEDRVAELESLLTSLGHDTAATDHWRSEGQFEHDGETQPPEDYVAIQDGTENTSTSPSTNREDGKPSLSLGFVFGSVIKMRKTSTIEAWKEDGSPTSGMKSEIAVRTGSIFVPPTVASRLLNGWIKYVSTQYPIIHTPRLREIHARRDENLDLFEESVLNLVYANSGRVLEAICDSGPFYPDQHYQAALQNMDAILELGDSRSVVFLLLLALYCLKGPRGPGAWTLAGLAVRLCIELGMHAKPQKSELTIEGEINVRLFWSCYYLDRGISMALGRPPAIADDDIDIDLPLDIDENVDDSEILRQASMNFKNNVARPPSSLTPFRHFVELRRVEHLIYRFNKRGKRPREGVQDFLSQLEAWKAAIPPEYHNRTNAKTGPYVDYDTFMIPYYKVIRLLLYPLLNERNLDLGYLKICADASAGICRAYKRLHRICGADCSPFTVQSLFLSGLTLIHCTWLAPRMCLDVVGAISDCNLMLYVIAERYPPAQKYRDVFDRIKTNVIEAIAQGNHQDTRDAGILDNEVTEQCRALDDGLISTVRNDYSQIISDLAKDRQKFKSDLQADPSSWQITGPVRDNGHTPRFELGSLSDPMMDYSLGYSHGSFIDSAFIDNLEDFSGVMDTDWDIPSV